MNVAVVASECAPFAKTGGLADVIGALPKHLAPLGIDVRIFVPKFASIDEKKFGLHLHEEYGKIPVRVAGIPRPVYLHSSVLPGTTVPVYFIDCAEYFHRENIYTDDPDEDERWILFSKAVIESLQRLRWTPDVIHCNDWQTGLMPLLMRDNYGWDKMFEHTAFLYTIHNIGYLGRFSEETVAKGELRSDLYYPGGPLEFENTVCMMKAGIGFSEVVSTVSRTYAKEILTSEFGHGMHHILRSRKHELFGVLNGIDAEEWNPETDRFIPHHYSKSDLAGKKKNKKALLTKTPIPFDDAKPLIGMISRLAPQKGFDLIEEALTPLMQLDAQWVILGTGDDRYERLFTTLSHDRPEQVWSYIGFNNELAHLIEAGADMFLMPSHYEPCGLNQMYSLRYGTVPIVRKTGGLADTVRDWHDHLADNDETGNGFTFSETSGASLATAVKRAVDTYKVPSLWKRIQLNGMADDNSWEHSAKEYLQLYHSTLKNRGT